MQLDYIPSPIQNKFGIAAALLMYFIHIPFYGFVIIFFLRENFQILVLENTPSSLIFLAAYYRKLIESSTKAKENFDEKMQKANLLQFEQDLGGLHCFKTSVAH